MGWTGKLLGGALGFLIGGPLGAALGFVGGSVYDESQEQQLTEQEKFSAIYFTSLFSLLAKVAKADGVVQKEEVNLIDDFIKNILKFDKEQRSIAIQIFNEAKKSEYTVEEYANAIYSLFENNQEVLYSILDLTFAVAVADGVLTKSEEEAILKVKSIFNISDDLYNSIKSRYTFKSQAGVEEAYALLGLQRGCSADEVKNKYKELVKQYHPDVIIGKGLPQDFVKFAQERFLKIQQAYNIVLEDINSQTLN